LRSSLFLAVAVLSATVRAQAEAPKGQYVGSASTLVEYLDPNTLGKPKTIRSPLK
jgi:hypothetical protein